MWSTAVGVTDGAPGSGATWLSPAHSLPVAGAAGPKAQRGWAGRGGLSLLLPLLTRHTVATGQVSSSVMGTFRDYVLLTTSTAAVVVRRRAWPGWLDAILLGFLSPFKIRLLWW